MNDPWWTWAITIGLLAFFLLTSMAPENSGQRFCETIADRC